MGTRGYLNHLLRSKVARICIPAGWMRWWRLFLDKWVPKSKAGRPMMELVDSAWPEEATVPMQSLNLLARGGHRRAMPAHRAKLQAAAQVSKPPAKNTPEVPEVVSEDLK